MTTVAGRKIREHRRAQEPRLTREAFAARIGSAGSTVSGWEEHGKIASPAFANRIAGLGIASHADWYRPARCPTCDIEGDAAGVECCVVAGCPLAEARAA